MQLYGYFRSSASYRVRLALSIKGLPYEAIPVHLRRNGGEQLSDAFRALNPEALVPVLLDADETTGQSIALSQSMAIIEYLEEKFPQPALLPTTMADRAYVRSLALAIACEIHPVNNLRVLIYLSQTLKISEEQKDSWYRHWCESGLAALEQRLASDTRTGLYCFGDAPSMADCFLIPQIANAQRFACDLSGMPTLMRINAQCLSTAAFIRALPENQADAE